MMSMVDDVRIDCCRSRRRVMVWTFAALLVFQLGHANATHYRIDPKETASSFEVWMLGVIPIRGQFKHTTGSLIFDAASHAGNIEVLIDTTSIEADFGRAEASVRGADFFNVDKYPHMGFKSSRFVFDGNRLRAVEGILTLIGTTQPVTLAVGHTTCGRTGAKEQPVCRAEASLTVKRSAFGMKAWTRTIGDDVTIRIAIVAFADAEDVNVLKSEKRDGTFPSAVREAIVTPKSP